MTVTLQSLKNEVQSWQPDRNQEFLIAHVWSISIVSLESRYCLNLKLESATSTFFQWQCVQKNIVVQVISRRTETVKCKRTSHISNESWTVTRCKYKNSFNRLHKADMMAFKEQKVKIALKNRKYITWNKWERFVCIG